MCGRYSIQKPITKTADLVKTNIKVEDTDNYNAHPTQKLPIIKSLDSLLLSKSSVHLFECLYILIKSIWFIFCKMT